MTTSFTKQEFSKSSFQKLLHLFSTYPKKLLLNDGTLEVPSSISVFSAGGEKDFLGDYVNKRKVIFACNVKLSITYKDNPIEGVVTFKYFWGESDRN